MAVIEIEGLAKNYGHVRAVDGLALTIERGELYGFLGPNGAGKTTTLRLLLGLARADAGSCRLRGHDARDHPRRAHAGVGYLPESLAFSRTTTVRSTLRFFARLRDVALERADEAIAQVGLEPEAELGAGTLSRGKQQLVGLAQALLADPEVLILDEPTGGLDPLAQRQIKDILLARHKQGATILFSSHQLGEVQEVATRVGVLRAGRLVAEDTVAGLRQRVGLRGILYLTVERPRPGLVDVVRMMEGVESARLEGARLAVVCADARRFDVARAVHDAGGGVLGMETRDATLEDIFISLTGAPHGGDP